MYRRCAAVHHVLLMPPIIKNLFAFFTEICYDVYKGYDTPSKGLQIRITGHPFIGRRIPKMLCRKRMPNQSGVRGMHTMRTFLGGRLFLPHPAARQLLNCCASAGSTMFPLSGSVGTR